MSEEEMKIVETVENFIKYYKKNEQTGNRANLDVLREECNAIEFILNKYDIQQKELEQEKEKNESLIKERATEIVYVDKNFVRKDKIKPIQIIDLDEKIHNVYKIEEE